MTTTALDRYLSVCVQVGCPKDQIRNFRLGHYCAQPKQLEFHAAARLADDENGPTEIGYGGARGPGKSHAVFAQVVLDDCVRAPGIKALYLRKIGKQAREQLDDLRRRVLRHIEHSYNKQSGVIEFPNGSRLYVGHFKNESDIDAYLGLEYDVIAVEEATSLTRTKYQALRDSNRTSRDDWRPRIYTTTNPGGVGHGWYKKTFIEPARIGRETETRFIFGTVDDNKFINSAYRRNLEKNTGWRLRAYRFGDWDISAGQFFTNWHRDQHVQQARALPVDWRWWLAMDYGFVHWNVVHLLAQSHDGHLYIVDEYAARRRLVEQHAHAVGEMTERWGVADRISTFVTGSDSFSRTKDGTTIADDWARYGYKLEQANSDRISGAAEMLRRLGDVENGIAPTLTIFENCTRLVECMPSLEHNPNRPEDVLKIDCDEDGEGGDDAYDTARYGVMVAAKKRLPMGVVVAY